MKIARAGAVKIARETFQEWRRRELTESTPGPKYCTRCGHGNDPNATYCAACRGSLEY